ncbi:flavin reductase (DIM6/NTAB) family NADH-FMN oxidoreductase RutF [Kitasatospora sp. MAP12-15]|uniref:flavin reductase family protein n=1 Tax=unclassified Kitasatospora TaxID=2633591 RepID=UPI002476AE32|nr:flavin reductase family protein [Kitasatospora sp. MAP12-44]MDH6112142.1 flavin reductase (DIM6/NTAB) family NADH-FMN oxidoreductase RutF [Kitasatospora sp. MAP12-44]
MAISPERFREVFGSFPTSVSVITALDDQGQPRGFTCNAVCAVSAAPPLLLICVDKNSQTLPAIAASGAFVVNVLASSGEEVSRLFAGKETDKFTAVDWRPSALADGAPILADVALAYAECRVVDTVEGGDHWIFIARVEGAEVAAREALLYFKRHYSVWNQELAAAH